VFPDSPVPNVATPVEESPKIELLSLSVVFLVIPLRLCFLFRTDLASFATLDIDLDPDLRFDLPPRVGHFRKRTRGSELLNIIAVVIQTNAKAIAHVPNLETSQDCFTFTCIIAYCCSTYAAN